MKNEKSKVRSLIITVFMLCNFLVISALWSTIAFATQAPKVTISTNDNIPSGAHSINYTIDINDTVSDFTIDDITVTNGKKVTLSANGNIYTLTVDYVADGERTVNVPAGVCFSTSGNKPGNAASNIYKIVMDNKTAPAVAISTTTTSPSNASSITYTFTFSEPVTGFTADDITVTNGTKGTLSSVTGSNIILGTTYTMPVTYVGDGAQTVYVAAGVCTDPVAYNNTASNTTSITMDRTAPTLTLLQDGSTIVPTAADVNGVNENSYKYAAGVKGIEYFATGGMPFTILNVPTNGTYTVYVKDKAGNGTVAKISVIVSGPTISLSNDVIMMNDGDTYGKMYFLSTAAVPQGYKIYECGVVMSTNTSNPDFQNKDSILSTNYPAKIIDGAYKFYALFHVTYDRTINVRPYIIYEDTTTSVRTTEYYGTPVAAKMTKK